MSEAPHPLEQAVREALHAYALDNAPLTLLGHNDNLTYRVVDHHGEAYVLRLNVPRTSALGRYSADEALLRSEMQWLEALCRDTALVLQQPVRNDAGQLVTTAPSEGRASPVGCTLLHWVEGERYHRGLESPDTARQIGVIAATLHGHAAQWVRPPGFTRPRRDAAYFAEALRALEPAVDDGRIDPADFAILRESVARLLDLLSTRPLTPATGGILHADMHKGNLLIHRGEMRLIDFSFCALGDYCFDLSICLSDMQEALHPAFLEGYRRVRPLPEGYARLTEAFFLGMMVGTFALWVPDPRAQDALARKVPQIARTYGLRLNRGEPFWFDA